MTTKEYARMQGSTIEYGNYIVATLNEGIPATTIDNFISYVQGNMPGVNTLDEKYSDGYADGYRIGFDEGAEGSISKSDIDMMVTSVELLMNHFDLTDFTDEQQSALKALFETIKNEMDNLTF